MTIVRAAGQAAVALLFASSVHGETAAPPERLQGVDRSAVSPLYAPGGFVPEYTPPAAGTYALPVISTVEDHPLVASDGKRTTLFALTGDRVAVVAFVYTSCVEATGCPVSHAVLHGLDRALADDPQLARRVQLITISFDPERDTPERMAAERKLHDPRTDWRLATTRDERELQPILDDFDQPVAKLRYEDGTWTGLFRHVLKVFLLDQRHRVRAIYSTGFLNQELLLNDLRTLAAGEP